MEYDHNIATDECDHEPTINADGLWVCRKCGVVLDSVIMLDLSKRREPRYTLMPLEKQFDEYFFKINPSLYSLFKKFKEINKECTYAAMSKLKYGKKEFEIAFKRCLENKNRYISALAKELDLPVPLVLKAFEIGRNRLEVARLLSEHMYGYVSINMILNIMRKIDARNTL